jgi:rubrerythrin
MKGKKTMPELKGSRTDGNLKAAFAGELQANRRGLNHASYGHRAMVPEAVWAELAGDAD